MNFEALREKCDSVFDVTAGPDSNNTVQSEGCLSIDTVNPRMSPSAPQESGVKHIRQTNIAHVNTAAGEKTTCLVRFNAATDEWR